MLYEPNENVIFQLPVPAEELEFSGERFTTAVQGEVRHEHLHRYLFALQFCRHKDVLDVASGEGYGAALISTVARSVTGIDISAEAIEHAQKNYAGVRYIAGRAESLPLPDHSIDVVLSFETIEHLLDHSSFFQEIKRVLRPDGLLVMSSPDRDVYSIKQGIQNPHHLKELNSREFQTLVRDNFRHSSFLGQISMAGSILVPQSGDLSGLRVQGFRHLSGNFVEGSPGVPSATYIISVASDENLPNIFTGSFDDRPFQLGLYNELQQRQIRVLQGEAEIANLRSELAALQSRILQPQSEREEVSKKIVDLEAALLERDERIASLNVNPGEIERLGALIADQADSANALRVELAEKQQEIERLTLLAGREAASADSLKAELAAKQQEIERAVNAINQETASVRSLQAQLAESRLATAERNAAVIDYSAKCAAAQQQLDAIFASRLWRLSKRLRTVAAYTRSSPLRFVTTFSLRRHRRTVRSLRGSPLFDASYYLRQNPDVAAKRIDPLLHYVARGAAEGRDPSPLFDTSYYLEQNPDVRAAGVNPLLHYLAGGATENRDPNPLFDTSYYLEQNPDVAAAGINPLLHYLSDGAAENRHPNLLFDTSYYLERNPDVAAGGVNPLQHYLTFGAEEKRNPSPLFDSSFYLEQNPDLAMAGVNPLIHYLAFGAAERRKPNPLFDTSYYLEQNPDLAAAGVDPLLHYLQTGWKERRNPHPLFDVSYFLDMNPDLAAANVEPLSHYLRYGAIEGRDPHPLFHNHYYLQQNNDVAAAREIPLAHYCRKGFLEGRNPNPLFDSRYYLENNPDIAPAGTNPLLNFVTYGFPEGRSPHPLFNTSYYYKRNPDILLAKANPLAHFLSVGFSEDRDPHPLFDLSFYLQHSPWLSQAGHNPVLHYLDHGAWEGKDPHPHFDTSYYLDTYPQVRSSGVAPLVHYILYGRDRGYDPNPYAKNLLIPPPDLNCKPVGRSTHQPVRGSALRYQPLISVVMPTYNSPPKFLELAIKSVQQQTYSNWELCICDDGSSLQETLTLLEREARLDDRIHLTHSPKNQGISNATNQALSMAEGEFVAFIDHDDEITRDALYEIAQAINAHPDVDVLYSDQDYVNEDGSLYSKFYKPDWSPELFRGVMYVGHLLVARRTLALEVGGCDSKFDFVQDFEFMLRLSERTRQIVHVPRILYHWRRIQGSVALHGDAKPGIESLQAAAVNAHFQRCGFAAVATSNPSHAHRLLIHPAPRKSSPTITILLDVREKSQDLSRSLASILDQTTYSSFEIGVIDSIKDGTDSFSLPFRVMGKTLSSALAQSNGEFVVLIRPEIEILSPNWLNHLLLYAERAEIACVGPLVLEPEGNVSNAGLIVMDDSEVRMAMHGFPVESDGYAGSLSCAREVTALDSVCIMVETKKLREMQLVEEYGPGPYQIVDLCMRAAKSGMRNICNPRAVVKRIRQPIQGAAPLFDEFLFQNLWSQEAAKYDPYHNPNFGNTDFGTPVLTR